MSEPLKIECSVQFKTRGRKGARKITLATSEAPLGLGNLYRATRLMALAIRLQNLLVEYPLLDYAELARLGRVTRARISQIMNLNLLAPDVQESLLFLPPITRGRGGLPLRALQPIALALEWDEQRRLWNELLATLPNVAETDSADQHTS